MYVNYMTLFWTLFNIAIITLIVCVIIHFIRKRW